MTHHRGLSPKDDGLAAPPQRRVFISYQRDADNDRLREVVNRLKRQQVVFFDQESISPGQVWTNRLQEELDRADVLIAFITRPSPSDWVHVELERAISRGIPIIPVNAGLPESSLSMRLKSQIGSIQWVEWDGKDVSGLCNKLEVCIPRAESPPARTPPPPARRPRVTGQYLVAASMVLVGLGSFAGWRIGRTEPPSSGVPSNLESPPKPLPAPVLPTRPAAALHEITILLRIGADPTAVAIDGKPAVVEQHAGLATLRLPAGPHRIVAEYTGMTCSATFSAPTKEVITASCVPQ